MTAARTCAALLLVSMLSGVEAWAADEAPECSPEPETFCRKPVAALDDPALQAIDPDIRRLAEDVLWGDAGRPLHREYADLVERLGADGAGPPFNWREKALQSDAGAPRRSLGPAPGALPSQGSWIPVGPTNLPGRMTDLAWDPSALTLYATGADGGLWRTGDGGATWTPLTDGLETLAIGAVATDPASPRNVVLGTGEGNFSADSLDGVGVFRSTNAGATWTKATFPGSPPLGGPPKNVRRIVYDPTDSLKVWLVGSAGVFRSVDGGLGWSKIQGGGLPFGFVEGTDIAIHPTNAQKIWVAIGNYAGSGYNGIYRSYDGGSNWTKLATGLPSDWGTLGRISLAMSDQDPRVMVAAIQDFVTANRYGLRGVYKTINSGDSWSPLSLGDFCSGSKGKQCYYNLSLAFGKGSSTTIYAGGIDILRSTDGGVVWRQMSDGNLSPAATGYVHHDIHRILSIGSYDFWVASDGGVSHSTDGGTTWALRIGNGQIGSSLETAQFYSLSLHPSDATRTWVGGQDVGTLIRTGGPSFGVIYGGDGIDGGSTVVHPGDTSIVLGEDTYLDVKRFQNGGAQVLARRPTLDTNEKTRFIAPLTIDPTNANVVYCGSQRVWRNLDALATNAWVDISGYFPNTSAGSGASLASIVVAPSNPNRVYVGSVGGVGLNTFLYTTANALTPTPPATWTRAYYSPLPGNDTAADLAVHPTVDTTVYAVFRSWNFASQVYRSTNAGANWTNISSGFPQVPANTILLDPANPNTLLVGTDIGIRRSTDAGASWHDFGASLGLPNVRVDDLAFNPTTGVLQAATHGRGLWQFQAIANNPREAAADDSLRASKLTGDAIEIAFTPSCGADGHAVYVGSLPIVDALTWTAQTCSLPASGPLSVDIAPPSAYFVLVGTGSIVGREGSYGQDSANVERPAKAGACATQDLSNSCSP